MKTYAALAATLALIPVASVVLTQLFVGAPVLMAAATLAVVVVVALIACEIAGR